MDAIAEWAVGLLAAVGREVDGLVGWGALAHAAHLRDEEPSAPNREPWGHLDVTPASNT